MREPLQSGQVTGAEGVTGMKGSYTLETAQSLRAPSSARYVASTALATRLGPLSDTQIVRPATAYAIFLASSALGPTSTSTSTSASTLRENRASPTVGMAPQSTSFYTVASLVASLSEPCLDGSQG